MVCLDRFSLQEYVNILHLIMLGNAIKKNYGKMTNCSYMCINCGYNIKELYKKYSNTVKTINCEKCHNVADKYIEFEPVIILVDSMLLSQQAYRHSLFNRDFKLFWKLSLMLLLLESFILWREKREQTHGTSHPILVNEHGFYLCCAQNLLDNLLCTSLLFLATVTLKSSIMLNYASKSFGLILLKANVLANFSKFFLLPSILWRENTTDFGVALHRTLVMGHHLCSLIFVFSVATKLHALQAALIVLPVYIIKELLMPHISMFMEQRFSDS